MQFHDALDAICYIKTYITFVLIFSVDDFHEHSHLENNNFFSYMSTVLNKACTFIFTC